MARRRVQVDHKVDLWTMPDAEASLLRRPLVALLARLGPDYLHRTQLRFLETGTELRAKSRGGVEFKYRLAGLLRRGKWPGKEIRYPVFESLPLYRLLNSLPDQEIGLTWPQPGTTALHASAATFQIPTLWEAAKPEPTPATPAGVTECYTADWLGMCASVCPFAKSPTREGESRFQQCQLSLARSPTGGWLTLTGTDSRMLARCTVDAFYAHGQNPTAEATTRLLSADLRWTSRILAAIQPECLRIEFYDYGVELTAHDLWLRIPRSSAYSNLPDFKVVCQPTENYKAIWRTTSHDLRAALLAATGFQTAAEAQPVELVLSTGGVALRARANSWTSVVRAAGEYNGPSQSVWFDAGRLLQCLTSAVPQPVRLCFGTSVLDDALRVEFPTANSFYLFMPMVPDSQGNTPGPAAVASPDQEES